MEDIPQEADGTLLGLPESQDEIDVSKYFSHLKLRTYNSLNFRILLSTTLPTIEGYQH